MHETNHTSRIWQIDQKSKEFVLRIGKYQTIRTEEHQFRFICDTGFHSEDSQNYWMFLPQLEYQKVLPTKTELKPSSAPQSF